MQKKIRSKKVGIGGEKKKEESEEKGEEFFLGVLERKGVLVELEEEAKNKGACSRWGVQDTELRREISRYDHLFFLYIFHFIRLSRSDPW